MNGKDKYNGKAKECNDYPIAYDVAWLKCEWKGMQTQQVPEGMVPIQIAGYAHPGKTHSSVGYTYSLFFVNLSFFNDIYKACSPIEGAMH